MDRTTRRNLVMILVAFIVIAAMVLSVYIILTRKHEPSSTTEDTLELTEVQKITSTDLSVSYPASAPAVLDYYHRINQALFSMECTQEEIAQLAHQEWMLFDEELQAINPEEYMVSQIRAEVNQKRADGLSVASYVIPSAREINDTSKIMDSREVVSAQTIVNMRKGQVRYSYHYTFLLRKDTQNRWKILGFEESGQLTQ